MLLDRSRRMLSLMKFEISFSPLGVQFPFTFNPVLIVRLGIDQSEDFISLWAVITPQNFEFGGSPDGPR